MHLLFISNIYMLLHSRKFSAKKQKAKKEEEEEEKEKKCFSSEK